MYSLNVPVPGQVKRLAVDLHPRLVEFDRVREHHSLVCKRFETEAYDRLYERVRRTLAGAPAFEMRVTGIEYFEEPIRGPGPVVYLAVESPGLRSLHDRLVETFGAVPDLEGSDYVPHVTLARSGSVEQANALETLNVDPVEWTVTDLTIEDHRHGERVATLSLPFGPS